MSHVTAMDNLIGFGVRQLTERACFCRLDCIASVLADLLVRTCEFCT